MCKLKSASYDVCDGIIGSVTLPQELSEKISEDEFNSLMTMGNEIAAYVMKCAIRHICEFTPEQQEYLKMISAAFDEE